VAQRDLRRIRAAAKRVERSRVLLREAILAANKSGESVRDMAPYAGLSPARVHGLLKEAQELERRKDG
jgi:hypothetical protein